MAIATYFMVMCIYAHLTANEQQQKVRRWMSQVLIVTTHVDELFLTDKFLLIQLCGLGKAS